MPGGLYRHGIGTILREMRVGMDWIEKSVRGRGRCCRLHADPEPTVFQTVSLAVSVEGDWTAEP